MSLKRQSSARRDGYAPAVPSPLNPKTCNPIQPTQQSHHRRRIRVVGRAGSKQSPTEILLRYKAAIAFHDHTAAAGRMKDLEAQRALNNESSAACDLGLRSSSTQCADESGRPTATRPSTSRRQQETSRNSGRSSARYSPVSRNPDTTDLVLRLVASGPSLRDGGSDLLKGRTTCTTTSRTTSPAVRSSRASLDDCKADTDGSTEFLVDFSGVTIDTLTAAVLVEQRRTLLAWATPGRMLWVLGLVSGLLILIFVRLQALSARYLTP